jgi:hypothetical protein
VLNRLLDPKQGMPFAMRAVIRTRLGLPAETNVPSAAPISTNTPAPVVLTGTNSTTSAGE